MKLNASPLVTRYGLLFLLTVQNTATILCLRSSMIGASTSNSTQSSDGNRNGGFLSRELRQHQSMKRLDIVPPPSKKSQYVVSTLILTVELIKLSFNIVLLSVGQLKCSLRKTLHLLYRQIVCHPFNLLPLAVPSFLYVLQDNLVICALSCLDAATYQVTYQVRILTTAFFARVLLKQALTLSRFLALVLLMFGVVLAQLNFDEKVDSKNDQSGAQEAAYYFGVALVGCATLTSGFAGVYTEKLIKDGKQPMLFVRNIQLSIFSILFACLEVVLKDGSLVTSQGYFHGYTSFVWLIAIMQASGGIIIAATIKFADNILKTFATSISIVLSCLISYFFLGDLKFTPTFGLGTASIISAVILYSRSSSSESKSFEKSNLFFKPHQPKQLV